MYGKRSTALASPEATAPASRKSRWFATIAQAHQPKPPIAATNPMSAAITLAIDGLEAPKISRAAGPIVAAANSAPAARPP